GVATVAAGGGGTPRPLSRGPPPRAPGPPRPPAAPAPLAGHHHRNVGRRGHGRAGRRARQLLAAVRPPRRERQVAAGHPARGGQQRRPGHGQPRWPIRGGRVPAQPGPVLPPPPPPPPPP